MLSIGVHLAAILFFSLPGCGPAIQMKQHGVASWYGPDFYGNQTANQEHFDPSKLTAAHKTLPFGAYVRVKRIDNGQSVIVRINDRGPFIRGRIIDLTETAAKEIDMLEIGITPVVLYVIDIPQAHD